VRPSLAESTRLPRNSFSASALGIERDENTRPTSSNIDNVSAEHDIPRLRGCTQRPMTDLSYQRSSDLWYESRQRMTASCSEERIEALAAMAMLFS